MTAIKGRVRGLTAAMLALSAMSFTAHAADDTVRVGSKIDTEGSLLGNIIIQVLEANGIHTTNKLQLGTTKVVRGAITAGEIDIYPEYTGNGAFFFSDEKDPAWKNAQAGFDKVKNLITTRTRLSGLIRLRRITPGLSRCVRMWRVRMI